MPSSKCSEVMSAAQNLKILCRKPKVKKEFASQVQADCQDFVKAIPDFDKALDGLEFVPLDKFSHPKDVLTFIEDAIKSGIAAQDERGLIFVLGNKDTGKTSLVKTFESCVKNPSKEPTSVLTKPGDGLIETQLLEVYDNLSLKQEETFKVELLSNTSPPTLVKSEEVLVAAANKNKEERLQLKIVDMGRLN